METLNLFLNRLAFLIKLVERIAESSRMEGIIRVNHPAVTSVYAFVQDHQASIPGLVSYARYCQDTNACFLGDAIKVHPFGEPGYDARMYGEYLAYVQACVSEYALVRDVLAATA